jgi:hypothetical protein
MTKRDVVKLVALLVAPPTPCSRVPVALTPPSFKSILLLALTDRVVGGSGSVSGDFYGNVKGELTVKGGSEEAQQLP